MNRTVALNRHLFEAGVHDSLTFLIRFGAPDGLFHRLVTTTVARAGLAVVLARLTALCWTTSVAADTAEEASLGFRSAEQREGCRVQVQLARLVERLDERQADEAEEPKRVPSPGRPTPRPPAQPKPAEPQPAAKDAASCPPHSDYRDGKCVCNRYYHPAGSKCIPRDESKSDGDGGTNGTPRPKDEPCPNGEHRDRRSRQCVPNEAQRPQKRECPPGYRTLETPNKYGAYCEPANKPSNGDGGSNGSKPGTDNSGKCPTWAPEGKPPNCHCPAGTVRRGNFCGVAQCPPNMTGTPPNCHVKCPTGTVNQNEMCVPVSKPAPRPQPTGPTPKPVPQQPKCLGDKKLINGVCRCPPSAPKDIGNNQCDSPGPK